MSSHPDGETHKPYIPADQILPEITFKAVVLGIVLSAVLAAANAYLGLFAGMTVSASIPAAVISMGILRLFKQSNILENNIVQTAASAGESLAAGVIFTMPALILMKTWDHFDYLQTTAIAGLGGIMGVLFTIPLRRALIVESPLKFPEGVATAEVLKIGSTGGSGVRHVITGGFFGGLFKLCAGGLRVWEESAGIVAHLGKGLFFLGSNLSPALIAVGFIVGLDISILMFLGGAFNWWIIIPYLTSTGDSLLPAHDLVGFLWSTQTRYLGVGAMVVGGLWALVSMRHSLLSGVTSSIAAYKAARAGTSSKVRTEDDIPMPIVALALVFCLVPLTLIFYKYTHSAGIAAFMAIMMTVAGFLFSAVAGYMAGLVGSSNNPISGVTIATILTSSLLLLGLLGADNPLGPPAAIFIGAVVCCAAAIAGDNMQDLKAGHILGATPRNQQIMQIVGVVAAAVVIAPILSLILAAYGIGEKTLEHPNALSAPQATLMMSVATGVFGKGLPQMMVAIGALLAACVIGLDEWLKSRGSSFRTPVLAVAVGVYLPLELEVPILFGGLIAWAVTRAYAALPEDDLETGKRDGVLLCAGLITGEALVGIGLAVPIVMSGNANVLSLQTLMGWTEALKPLNLLGIALLIGVMGMMYHIALGAKRDARKA